MSEARALNALHWSSVGVADPTVVLYSGGRDSTLASLRCVLKGEFPVLTVFDTGLGVGRNLVEYRIAELTASLGAGRFDVANVPIYGLVRAIAMRSLVEDIVRDGVNLIPLGESLAMHAAAVVLARRLGAGRVVNGFAGYQSGLPEQGADALARISRFVAEYGIKLEAPLQHVDSVQTVQYELLEYGVSPKSLEGVSVLADCCEPASPEVVGTYIDAKLPIMRDYVRRLLGDV